MENVFANCERLLQKTLKIISMLVLIGAFNNIWKYININNTILKLFKE